LKRPSRSFKVIVFDKERISSVETMAPSQSYRFRDISTCLGISLRSNHTYGHCQCNTGIVMRYTTVKAQFRTCSIRPGNILELMD